MRDGESCPVQASCPLSTTHPTGTGTQGCGGSLAFIPLPVKALKELRKSKARDEACICTVHFSKTNHSGRRKFTGKAIPSAFPELLGLGEKKNKKAAETEKEEFNISICSYPNKLRCICGSVREARRNETIK